MERRSMTSKKELERRQDYPVSRSFRYTGRERNTKDNQRSESTITDKNVEERMNEQARLFGMTLEEYKEKIIKGGSETES